MWPFRGGSSPPGSHSLFLLFFASVTCPIMEEMRTTPVLSSGLVSEKASGIVKMVSSNGRIRGDSTS